MQPLLDQVAAPSGFCDEDASLPPAGLVDLRELMQPFLDQVAAGPPFANGVSPMPRPRMHSACYPLPAWRGAV